MVKKRIVLSSSLMFFIIFLALVSPGQTGLAAELSADTIQTMPHGKFQGKFYIKGDKMRSETSVQGQTQVMIIRQDLGLSWMMMPNNMVMEIPLPEDPRSFAQNQDQLEEMAQKESLGQETVEGYECEVSLYKFHDAAYGTMTQWFSKKLNWPVKIESKSEYGTVLSEYKNIKVGSVPDDLFEIPAGYQKMSMPGMQMPKMGQ